jgi:hypothetical protein
LWRVFKKDRRARMLRGQSVNDIFNELLLTHQISLSGTELYETGKKFTDKEKVNMFAENVLTPRFENLKAEFSLIVNERKNKITEEIEITEAAINKINENLNETNAESELYKLNLALTAIKTRKEEIENISFPEKKFQSYAKEAFQQYKNNLEKISSAGSTDQEVLSAGLKQKEILYYTSRETGGFKKFLDSIRTTIHSLYYPPTLKTIRFFFLLCFLLVICETGISNIIINNITNTQLPDGLLLVVTVLYGIGISIALASFYKLLIDSLLFREKRKVRFFWAIHGLLTLAMTIFFSSEYGGRNKYFITQTGLVLGFFSTSFSLANAFLFREAIYLLHQYRKLYPFKSEKGIYNKKNNLIKKYEKILEKKETACSILKYQLNNVDSPQVSEITAQISRLEKISNTNLWHGFDQGINDIISNNQDIVLAMTKNIKTKLNI